MFITDASAVNSKVTKKLLAKGVGTFYINVKLTFIKGPRKLCNSPFW